MSGPPAPHLDSVSIKQRSLNARRGTRTVTTVHVAGRQKERSGDQTGRRIGGIVILRTQVPFDSIDTPGFSGAITCRQKGLTGFAIRNSCVRVFAPTAPRAGQDTLADPARTDREARKFRRGRSSRPEHAPPLIPV